MKKKLHFRTKIDNIGTLIAIEGFELLLKRNAVDLVSSTGRSQRS